MTVGTLRERARQAVAAEIGTVALELFAARGYDATTVDEIAEAAGISRRSFFRYFATKEEVVLRSLAATGEGIGDVLAGRPDAEADWEALRVTLHTITDRVDADPAGSVFVLRMLLGHPALHGSLLARQTAWRRVLGDALVVRRSRASEGVPGNGAPGEGAPADGPVDGVGGARTDVVALALAGAALSCLEAAQVAWLDARGADGSDAPSLGTFLDAAMSAVRTA